MNFLSTFSRSLSTVNQRGIKMTSGSRIQAALIDLSGTLHVDDTAIEGAQGALQRLRDSGVQVKFVTNTTKEPLSALHARLQMLQFNIQKKEIFTSLTAARNIVKERELRPLLYLEESAKEDFTGISEEDPNAVVIGLSPAHFNYSPMNDAFRLILDGAPLIAIHKARYFKKKDGLYLGPGPFVTGLEYATDRKAEVVGKPEKRFFLDAIKDLNCDAARTVMIGDDARDDVGGAMKAGMLGVLVKTGPFVTGLEYATDRKAEVVGKPEKRFFLDAIKDLNCDAARTVMIGDDARDDVGGAMKAGMLGVLVKTGKYRPGDEEKVEPRPTATCTDFTSAVDFILEHNKLVTSQRHKPPTMT